MKAGEKRFLSGNEACAIAAIDGGVGFFAGYPITPSSEIAEYLARELPAHGGVFLQMEDEIASISACIGARMNGVIAMTATSGPGFSLMQESIGYACMAETPVVIVNSMRGGPSTGLPTKVMQSDLQQCRWGTHGDHAVIVLAPNSIRETYELTQKAILLSERFRVPAVLLMDEVISHMRETAVFPDAQRAPKPEARKRDGYRYFDEGWKPGDARIPFGEGARYHITGLAHDPRGIPTNDPEIAERNVKRVAHALDGHAEELTDTTLIGPNAPEALLVSYGSPSRAARQAAQTLTESGLPTALLRLRILWPFPDEALARFDGTPRVFSVELSDGQLAREVERVMKRSPVELINKLSGELILPEEIITGVQNAKTAQV